MFSKKFRLAKTTDVQNVFSRGRSLFGPLATIKFVSGVKHRLTVVVSTKVDKRAVKRNRIKRIVREFLRSDLPRLIPGDYAVVIKPQAGRAEEKLILNSLELALKKNRLLV